MSSSDPVPASGSSSAADTSDAASASAPAVPAVPRATIRRLLGLESGRVLLLIEFPSGKSVRMECSSADVVLDVRQFLLDCPEACECTCYHLESTEFGFILNDYVELGEYPQLCDGEQHVIRMEPEFYDERSARLHVRRIREIIAKPPGQIVQTLVPVMEQIKESGGSRKKGKQSASKVEESSNPLVAAKHFDSSFSLAQSVSTAELKPAPAAIQECIKSITFSGWNPPPSNRRLRGDLLYLEILTLEDRILHVTASVDGFFVNRTEAGKFDPNPAESSYKSHALIDLLKRASPQFNARFTSLLSRKIPQHPFDGAETPNPQPNKWIVDAQSQLHTFDWNRSEDSLLATFGMDSRGLTRDWNEEIQACKELPKASLDERLMRDRTSYRVYSDFVDAATKGACAVVQGHIPPVNPMDPPRQHVFIYNSIFFSFAIDSRDLYASAGGDRVSHALAAHDLNGVAQLARLDLPELYTLATVLVDYRGHRVIAQSIIPGIFNGDRASKHVYGSMDQGKTIEAKPEFHALVKKAANELHVSEHTLITEAGDKVTIASTFESKGIVGSDGRAYLLDLLRVQPRDANYPDHLQHPTALLRPELISRFCRKIAMEKAFPQSKAGEEKEKEKDSAALDAAYIEAFSSVKFNVDLLTGAKLGDAEDKLKADRELIESAAKFLTGEVIPKFLTACRGLEFSPVDSDSLTQLLHEQGINMRYLGSMVNSLRSSGPALPHLEKLMISEMIVRAAKRILFELMRDVHPDRSQKAENWFFGPTIARFLSSLFGPHCCGANMKSDELTAAQTVLKQLRSDKPEEVSRKAKKGGKKEKDNVIRLQDGRRAPSNLTAPANIWQSIRETVAEKFQFNLPESVAFTTREKVSMLRALCKKAGIQIIAKDYDLAPASNNQSPFTVDDILDLQPIVKASFPSSIDAANALQTGRAFLAQGRISAAYELVQESLIAHTQVYGPMHRDTAQCFATLALLMYQFGDFNQAIDYQQRALIIHERVLGADHAETAHSHMNLALFLHSAGHAEAALRHVKRALYLFELICGPEHPDTAAAHMNLAMIYQDIALFDVAIKHLERALAINQATLGGAHLQTALSHHTIAVAQAFNGQYRTAIEEEKKAKGIFSQSLGPKHTRTQQSHTWFEHFTSLAVKAAGGKDNASAQPLSVIPPSLGIQSPLTWVSLQGSLSVKGRMTMNDILQLLEVASRQEKGDENAAAAAAQTKA